MSKPTVAYLGPINSYSHQAALQQFVGRDVILVPKETFKAIFISIEHDEVGFGIVPFENSTFGPVGATLDLFADALKLVPSVRVTDETFLAVHHTLAGRRSPKSKADVALQDGELPEWLRAHLLTIQNVYSHPQALGQCIDFLATYMPQAQQNEVSSTSLAADIVAKDKTNSSVAITSRMAAEYNGLDVLAEGVEDSKDNTTRFFTLKRAEHEDPRRSEDYEGAEPAKCLISFKIDHSRPGALAEALVVFKSCNLNLTSIYPRPSKLKAWHYIFLVEVEAGSLEGSDRSIEHALGKLKETAYECRSLGIWVDWRLCHPK